MARYHACFSWQDKQQQQLTCHIRFIVALTRNVCQHQFISAHLPFAIDWICAVTAKVPWHSLWLLMIIMSLFVQVRSVCACACAWLVDNTATVFDFLPSSCQLPFSPTLGPFTLVHCGQMRREVVSAVDISHGRHYFPLDVLLMNYSIVVAQKPTACLFVVAAVLAPKWFHFITSSVNKNESQIEKLQQQQEGKVGRGRSQVCWCLWSSLSLLLGNTFHLLHCSFLTATLSTLNQMVCEIVFSRKDKFSFAAKKGNPKSSIKAHISFFLAPVIWLPPLLLTDSVWRLWSAIRQLMMHTLTQINNNYDDETPLGQGSALISGQVKEKRLGKLYRECWGKIALVKVNFFINRHSTSLWRVAW